MNLKKKNALPDTTLYLYFLACPNTQNREESIDIVQTNSNF